MEDFSAPITKIKFIQNIEIISMLKDASYELRCFWVSSWRLRRLIFFSSNFLSWTLTMVKMMIICTMLFDNMYLQFQLCFKMIVADGLILQLLSPDVLFVWIIVCALSRCQFQVFKPFYFLLLALDFHDKFSDFLILEMNFIFQDLESRKCNLF